MGLTFTIQYHIKVVSDDIPRIPSANKRRIQLAIEQKLMIQPEVFGVPLRRSLKGYRKLRIGDYRVIFRIENTLIKVLVIQHRSNVYKAAAKRLV